MIVERLMQLINLHAIVWYDGVIKIELRPKEWFIQWNSGLPVLCQKVENEVLDFVNKYDIRKLTETKTMI